MKRFLYVSVLVLLLMGNIRTHAQNLVLNGDFESYINPPTGSGLLLENHVHDWASYYNTPDYFSTEFMGEAGMLDYCGTLPHSGKGIIGAYVLGYFPTVGYNREYLQGSLSEPLKANTLYYAEVYVKPMLRSPVINFGIDKIGIAFTDKHFSFDDTWAGRIDEEPEVENKSGIIRDLNDWTKVSGCFVAQGGETKIIIGNFRKDSETDSMQLPGATGEEQVRAGMSYYMFDDVMVKEVAPAYITPGDTLACRDSLVTLTAFPEGGSSYTWNTGDNTQAITTHKAGTFTVKIITKEGCTLEASATINTKYCGPVCPQLMIPTAFSPNGDGLNDYFQPMNSVDMSQLEMSVYNRLGQRVFYGTGLKTKWDGQYHNKPCDVGTYFYYSRYADCHGLEFTVRGDVVLLR